ncbi:MAG TPA: non-heme iron oxygenase ferredoxin subunit [Gammaproteobacteria bacterium]|nr:non-heme iron oxygenase ferredoxin subunit [Gammaproteobacteria bacterium]
MSDWIDVCPAAELPPGGHRVVALEDTRVAVYGLDGGYYAIEDMCTHDYAEIACGRLEGDQIICPRHGARFSIKTGAALTPPAFEPIHTFPVRVENGVVQLRDDRWDD